jgi:hypothetical protein
MSATKMWRKTTCNTCGFTQSTVLSYYLDRKQWKASHTRTVHDERMATIGQLDFTKLGNHIKNQELLNSLN